MTEHEHPQHDGLHPITIGSAAARLRRSLGSQAWCVLECLATRATLRPDGVTAVASVRALAVELGIAKNTAQRALATLVGAGLAEPDRRRRPDGTFSAGCYRLHLGEAMTLTIDEATAPSPGLERGDQPDPPTHLAPTSTPRRTRRAPRSSLDADQLSLFDA